MPAVDTAGKAYTRLLKKAKTAAASGDFPGADEVLNHLAADARVTQALAVTAADRRQLKVICEQARLRRLRK